MFRVFKYGINISLHFGAAIINITFHMLTADMQVSFMLTVTKCCLTVRIKVTLTL